MRCLLGWIGSIAVESDVLFVCVSQNKESFGRFIEENRTRFIFLRSVVLVRHWISKLYIGERAIMSEGEDSVELKFRIYDGTDIGHETYASSMTVGTLKQRLFAEWPQGKRVNPKSPNDVKIIHGGKVLEISKTLSDYKKTFSDVPNGVITMHAVIQPQAAKKKTDRNVEENQQMSSCSCTIL